MLSSVKVSRAAALATLAIAGVARVAAAQTGTVVGRVTNAITGAPVTTVQVMITGLSLGSAVDADGTFRLANVPAGAREIVARSIGYTPRATAFSVVSNETVTVDLPLTISTIELDAVFVTGSRGDMRRRAIGNSVAVVDASEVVARSAVTNITELLQAKVPGLTLLPGSGTVGTAALYRLRGAGSLFATNNPTIYVDGVRVSTRVQGNYYPFGQGTTALDAINPADIESIEVLKGPAAATLYGAEAAPGVIQIFTKKGRSGRIAWDSRLETGRSDWDEALRPVNYAIATAARLADTVQWPGFRGKSLGDILSFRTMTDGRALRIAGLTKFVLSASGGADRSNFFVSAGMSDEEGVYFNNFSNLASLRGNFTFVPANTLTFTANVALSNNHVRLPLNDNANVGLIFSSNLAEPGRSYPAPGGENYSSITPEIANTYDNQIRANRYIIGTSAEYVPLAWFKNTVRVGLDANVGRAELYFAPDPLSSFPSRYSLSLDNSKGLIAEGRPLTRDVTANYDGTLTGHLSDHLVSNTSFGVQYLSNLFQRTDAIGVGLGSTGLRTLASAAVTSSTDSSSEQKSVGFYAQQQLSLDDRLFVTVATRVDNNSAFGSTLHRVFYPKASASYVISEEPYFRVPGISTLRLRAAWGQAGSAPGPFDALRSYSATAVTDSTGTSSGVRYGSAGNADLRPERGTEIEVGFESTFRDGRIGMDGSFYHKTMRDALVAVPIPGSTGFSGTRLTNLGETSNAGLEMQVRASLIQRKALAVDATLSLATNTNKLVSFGYDRPPIIFSSNEPQRFQVGFPLGAMWAKRARYDQNGMLVKVNGLPVLDTGVYMGPSVPTREMFLSTGIVLFGRLRLYGLADYKGGHYQFNARDMRRERDAGVSWETVNPAANPDEVLVRRSSLQTFLYIQPADFLKLRDLSISYDVPERIRRSVVRRATFTLAGHNVKMWTKYRGSDPEVNAYGVSTAFNRNDMWTVPQTRRYSASLTLAF